MPVDFSLTVLVTGATGHQGGALTRQLLSRGHRVLALVRDVDSPAARQLESRGATLAHGDFEDVGSIERAAREADAMFAMASPFGPGGPDAETRQGINMVEAAKRANIRHFIYSSVAGADRLTGIPHFDSKHRVELYVRRSGLPATILAPTFFMENFLGPMLMEGLKSGVLAQGLPPTRGLEMVALDNVAALTMLALEHPERFVGERIELASDEVTGQQAAGLLSMVSGHRIKYVQVPLEDIRQSSEDLAMMYAWLNRVGYRVDVLTLRHDHPQVSWLTLEEWARHQDWSALTSPAWPGEPADPMTPAEP
ncbi:NmrA/HSCARG family protein [Corallococcus sp. H22C18031201]|nr:NmrA/HSCARG family protein [Corallococcus sp. H22C18031201]